jgi:hypothetical protein
MYLPTTTNQLVVEQFARLVEENQVYVEIVCFYYTNNILLYRFKKKLTFLVKTI